MCRPHLEDHCPSLLKPLGALLYYSVHLLFLLILSHGKIWWDVQDLIPIIRKMLTKANSLDSESKDKALETLIIHWHCLTYTEIETLLCPFPWLVLQPTFSLPCPLGSHERFCQMPCWHPALLDLQNFPDRQFSKHIFWKERRKGMGK